MINITTINYTDPLGGHPDNYPDSIYIYGSAMEFWHHAPYLEGYVNCPVQIGRPLFEEYDYLPYDDFSRFAQEEGWEL